MSEKPSMMPPQSEKRIEEMNLLDLDRKIESLSGPVNELIRKLSEEKDALLKKSIEMQLERAINKRAEYMMGETETAPKTVT